jgi:hypothetical protein
MGNIRTQSLSDRPLARLAEGGENLCHSGELCEFLEPASVHFGDHGHDILAG